MVPVCSAVDVEELWVLVWIVKREKVLYLLLVVGSMDSFLVNSGRSDDEERDGVCGFDCFGNVLKVSDLYRGEGRLVGNLLLFLGELFDFLLVAV